jgi:hypothetical protein
LHPEGPATGQLDQGFCDFPWSQSKWWIGIQISRCTACFTCRPSNNSIKSFTLMYPSWCQTEIRSDGAPLKLRRLCTMMYWLTDWLTDWLTVGCNFTLTLDWTILFLRDIYIYIYIYGDLALQVGGGLEYLHRSPVSCKRRHKGNPMPRATLFLGDINMGTWPSRSTESQTIQ